MRPSSSSVTQERPSRPGSANNTLAIRPLVGAAHHRVDTLVAVAVDLGKGDGGLDVPEASRQRHLLEVPARLGR
jgi:hypothetical protein